MTKREKDMIIWVYELFIEQIAMIKSDRITIDDLEETVKKAKERIEREETRADYDE